MTHYAIKRSGPGRPALTPEGELASLVQRYWLYSEKVPGTNGCRRRTGAHTLRRRDGSNIALFRVGWLIAHPEYTTVPEWITSAKTAPWHRECWTSACCAGEHISMDVPRDAHDEEVMAHRRPVLPPEAIAPPDDMS
jgi:hypothetical protein